MYGTIFKMKPKSGALQDVIAEFDRWKRERSPDVPGFVASYALESASGEVISVAVFENEASYRRNADDPEQDKWYQRLRSLLEADPEWNDGVIHG